MDHKDSNFRYEAHLRLVGRHLDVNNLRDIALFETQGGFVVRATNPKGRSLEALEFPFSMAPDLHNKAQSSRGGGERVQHVAPIYPTGYEDMLRALGAELDMKAATDIIILEMEERLIVRGLEYRESFHATAYGDFELEMRPGDIQGMLDTAFRRRGD